jgi:hypothetical protein
MLKRLAIFTVAAVVAVGVSALATGGGTKNKVDPQPDNRSENQDSQEAPSVVVQVGTQQGDTTCTKDKEDTDRDLAKYTRWLAIFTLILAIVSMVQGYFLYVHGVELSALAKAAKESADTASKQTSLYANAERARITMDISDMGERSFRIRGKNTGRTTAEIVLARGYTVTLPFGKPLPEPPPYLSEPDTFGDFVEFTAPNEFIEPIPDGEGYTFLANLNDINDCAAIRDKRSALWVYGRIVYNDGVSTERRETRFCYHATVSEELETDLVMSGSLSYRIAT